LERSGDYLGAAKSLMSVLDDIDASPEWDRVFEWIAADLGKVGDTAETGSWYGIAGQPLVAGDSSPVSFKVFQAPFFVQGPQTVAPGAGARAIWRAPGEGR
jgi:hypothetical protein